MAFNSENTAIWLILIAVVLILLESPTARFIALAMFVLALFLMLRRNI